MSWICLENYHQPNLKQRNNLSNENANLAPFPNLNQVFFACSVCAISYQFAVMRLCWCSI